MTLLPYAVSALQRGFTIFPVEPMGKTPLRLNSEDEYTIRWSEVATADTNAVARMWGNYPDANVGVACKPSRLLVVDCDAPKAAYQLKGGPFENLHETWGPLVDGTDVLKEIARRCGANWDQVMATYRVCTGRMGVHVYYRWPDGVTASQASIVKGLLDIRCNGGERGGYVLGAGSITTAGPYVAENDLPVTDCPPFLVELCREKQRPAKSQFSQPRALGNISGLVDTVLSAPDGNLNNALLWAARAACADGIPIDDAIAQLGGAYVASNGRGGARQAESTVRSGYRLQEGKERGWQ